MSNNQVSTPRLNEQVPNSLTVAAAQPVLRRHGAINLGHVQQHPNGTIVQPNIAAAARQANANAARAPSVAAAPATPDVDAAANAPSVVGGKRKHRKTRRTLRKTRHNKNKRTRKH
jgi:hypothetical protein